MFTDQRYRAALRRLNRNNVCNERHYGQLNTQCLLLLSIYVSVVAGFIVLRCSAAGIFFGLFWLVYNSPDFFHRIPPGLVYAGKPVLVLYGVFKITLCSRPSFREIEIVIIYKRLFCFLS
jgi:hypothetical protein